jgi:dienelactone hydrolase
MAQDHAGGANMPRHTRLFSVVLVLGLAAAMRMAVAADAPSAAAAAAPPSISEALTIPGWWVIGPFLTGVREAGVDPLAFDSGNPAGAFSNPLLAPAFPSALIPGGAARWRYYRSGEDGSLSVDYPEVTEAGMKLITDEWGAAGGNTVGFACATLHIDGGPRRALLELKGASAVSINGAPWPGDPYGNGAGTQPVLLPAGDSELKVAIGGSQSFSLRFLPVGSDIVIFTQSATLPDLTRGEAPPTLIGLPVANTTTQWMTVATAEINSQHLLGSVKPVNVRIPPLCVANLALELEPEVDRLPTDLAGETLPLLLTLYHDRGYIEVALNIGVKDFAQPHKVTFRSAMDNSVQYYGLLPPSNFDPQREYGLILSLHGAGVEAIGQAGAYRPKDWAYVAAPTNRRPFGFDWQDWGQRDMLEVLAEVKRTCKIDENRVHLTGHSMGGHGTWLNALTFPGLWASAAPSAGWTRFDLYSPMFLRRNVLYGDPKANYIWQLAMRGDDTLALCENALNLPIFAMEGGADDNVPPQQPRLLVERLKQLGYDITYKEVPGMGHWWDDPATPGTDCVDSAEQNAFWESHVRDPWPKEIRLRAGDKQDVRGAYWIKTKPINTVQDTVIDAKASDNGVAVTTVNAEQLQIQLPEHIPDTLTITVDGDVFRLTAPSLNALFPYLHFKLERGHWQYLLDGNIGKDISDEWISYLHSWKDMLIVPCTVVVPTDCTSEENEYCMQIARLYAYNWWYRGNGALTVMTDIQALSSLNSGELGDSLICISMPGKNQLLQHIVLGYRARALDKYVYHDAIVLGDYSFYSSDLSYKFTRGMSGKSLLEEGGTSLKALRRLAAMQGIYSGAGFPDWMVWDDEVKLKGLGGVLGMGFFDQDWNVTPELSYFNEELISRRASGT